MASTLRNTIYFASDMHLGMHPLEKSRFNEQRIVEWLNTISDSAAQLWLLGDVFDYWFEHKRVIPKGFSRFLGKLAELSDRGTEIHIFAGNHDVWYFDYLPAEIGAIIHHEPLIIDLLGKRLFLAHGDEVNPKDRGYRFLKKVFQNKFLQWCYARIHPNASAAFAQGWSRRSRYSKEMAHPFKGEDKEEQILFARNHQQENPEIDLYLFGHRHVPYDVKIGEHCRAICLGDWIVNFSYGVLDETGFRLETFKN